MSQYTLSSRWALLAAIAFGITLLALGYTLGRLAALTAPPQAPAPVAASEGAGAAASEVDAQLEALSDRVDRLSSQPGRPGGGASAAGSLEESREAARERVLEMVRERRASSDDIRLRQDVLQQRLQAEHEAQPVDPEWALDAEERLVESSLSSVIDRSGLRPTGLDMDCRSQTCRVSATFDNASDAGDWATMFITGTSSTWDRANTVLRPTSDGGVEIQIYGRRR